MTKTLIKMISIVLCLAMIIGAVSVLTACNDSNTKANYNVTYDLNYEGGEKRIQSYQSGITAIDWKASRDGYNIQGWYLDAECSEKFDFNTKIKSDMTLYAGWKEKPGITTVTFDFGYSGAANKVIEIEKGSTINKKYIPAKDRFGMALTGWYHDEALTMPWNFESDTVEDATTLHAKFEYTVNIPLNDDGSIKYENISVYVWNGCGGFSNSLLDPIVEEFNKEYDGKISVTVGPLTQQADVFVRIQQSSELMRCYTTYYPIADIYSLAGIDVNPDDYYTGAIRESMSKGVMLQTPFAAVVPYMVYNKTLMSKYSPNGLPTNYSELSAVLQKAAKGEATNNSFKSILTTDGWQFKECSSWIAFAQNNADYFTYENEIHTSIWKTEQGLANAKTALTNTYDLFGVNGLNGGTAYDIYSDNIARTVANGDALMGMLSWTGAESVILNNDNLGVMSLSGLFTDATDEASRRIPAYTLGVAFYNGATNVIADPVKMCASAVFADYLSKHAYLFADKGYVPVHKGTAEVDAYKNSDNAIIKLMKSIYRPEDLWTLPGMANTKYIINAVASENVIVPFLNDKNGSRDDVDTRLNNLYSQVGGLLA